ncbi:hypothetical protein JQ631_23945 [Bradyrhizobium manausense]|uniref:hypothetical protein n=1 Tax=Bradyrhizobium manausense TaxID=989370 RepID=UPI001BAAD116|nr:hypothetical protein [Bradyrhizobium manausense]MBR0792148.1 hypothetical protein [Bradyrhizobium manausense]
MYLSWADLDSDEQRTIAVLGAGLSIELCDPLALLTLRRLGLIVGFDLTAAGHDLRRDAVAKVSLARAQLESFDPW